MPRYFIELAYRGTKYSGFQTQANAVTIQSVVEEAIRTLERREVVLTGSSRTDTGVHALQNYFHFDFEGAVHEQFVYKMNAILPPDITIRRVVEMPAMAHARFDAIGREYMYCVHRFKNPFLQDRSLYYPYRLNYSLMQEAAAVVKEQTNFVSFSKTNTQVKNFLCTVRRSEWLFGEEELHYHIEANRFLRGMVRLLTATLLKVGREQLTPADLVRLFTAGEKCGFSVPAHGLFLKKVNYPQNYFSATGAPFTAF